MRQILVWVCLSWLVLSLASAQDLPSRLPQIRLKLVVGGHDSLKAPLQHVFKKELRALKSVVLVEKDAVTKRCLFSIHSFWSRCRNDTDPF